MRAADACQLAVALVACREHSATLDFVTLDDRLAEAARKKGLRVLPEVRASQGGSRELATTHGATQSRRSG